jgi:hypothetical protein
LLYKLGRPTLLRSSSHARHLGSNHIRILTIGVKPGSGLDLQMSNKGFILPSETQVISEQRLLLEKLDGINSHYANHHSVDLLLEVKGQLPDDKGRLLIILDRFLSLKEADQINFILGRRLGYYRRLSDQENDLQYQLVEKQVKRINQSDSIEELFHSLRMQGI